MKKLFFLVTEDWYFCSHRLSLAIAAKEAGFEVTVLTRIRDHGDLIEKAGLRVIPFEMTRRGLNPVREFATLLQLFRFYRREQPDIVHHVALKPALYGGLAARWAGVPAINAVAGLGWMFTASSHTAHVLAGIVPRWLAYALRGSDVIVQNPDDFAQIRKLGVERLHLIRGAGVDMQAYVPKPAPSGPPLVMLASRMLWNKGIGELVAAAQILRQQGMVARFVLVGRSDTGNPAAVPDTQLRAWHDAGAIEWWGQKADMAAIWPQAHLACLPTFYGEGIPRALIEAAACGLPIVTTDAPGSREVVEHGVNGLLVPVKDSVALAETLKKLILDTDLRRRMGVASRVKAVAEFSQEIVIEQTLALYRHPSSRVAPARS
ncbi:MAG: glycosyltransferase family 4 protein [Acidiferrobacteraceae bacterium]